MSDIIDNVGICSWILSIFLPILIDKNGSLKLWSKITFLPKHLLK